MNELLKKILDNTDNQVEKEYLTRLSEIILVEDIYSVSQFRLERVCQKLGSHIKLTDQPSLVLLSLQCLINLIRNCPNMGEMVLDHLDNFTTLLTEESPMAIVELTLTLLDILSEENDYILIRSCAISNCINIFSFVTDEFKRKIARIISNLTKEIPKKYLDLLLKDLLRLSNLLTNDQMCIVDRVTLSLTRIYNHFEKFQMKKTKYVKNIDLLNNFIFPFQNQDKLSVFTHNSLVGLINWVFKNWKNCQYHFLKLTDPIPFLKDLISRLVPDLTDNKTTNYQQTVLKLSHSRLNYVLLLNHLIPINKDHELFILLSQYADYKSKKHQNRTIKRATNKKRIKLTKVKTKKISRSTLHTLRQLENSNLNEDGNESIVEEFVETDKENENINENKSRRKRIIINRPKRGSQNDLSPSRKEKEKEKEMDRETENELEEEEELEIWILTKKGMKAYRDLLRSILPFIHEIYLQSSENLIIQMQCLVLFNKLYYYCKGNRNETENKFNSKNLDCFNHLFFNELNGYEFLYRLLNSKEIIIVTLGLLAVKNILSNIELNTENLFPFFKYGIIKKIFLLNKEKAISNNFNYNGLLKKIYKKIKKITINEPDIVNEKITKHLLNNKKKFEFEKLKKYLNNNHLTIYEAERIQLIETIFEKFNHRKLTINFFNTFFKNEKSLKKLTKKPNNNALFQFLNIIQKLISFYDNLMIKKDPKIIIKSKENFAFLKTPLCLCLIKDPKEKELKSYNGDLYYLEYTESIHTLERYLWGELHYLENNYFPGNQQDYLLMQNDKINIDYSSPRFYEGTKDITCLTKSKMLDKKLNNEETDHSIIFSINNIKLSYQTPIFKQIYSILSKNNKDFQLEDTIMIKYRKLDQLLDQEIIQNNYRFFLNQNNIYKKNEINKNQILTEKDNNQILEKNIQTNKNQKKELKKNHFKKYLIKYHLHKIYQKNQNLYQYLIKEVSKENVDINLDFLKLLTVLRNIYSMNEIGLVVPKTFFYSKHLINKMNRQFESYESTIKCLLPKWIHILMGNGFSFLFDYQTKMKYFRRTTFSINDTVQDMIKELNKNIDEIHSIPIQRTQRFKVKVSRDNIFKEAMFIMKMPQIKTGSILEVEFENEIGTGNGPSNEFFTIISNKFCSRRDNEINIWYDTYSNENDEFIRAPNGLYPLPIMSGFSNGDGKRIQDEDEDEDEDDDENENENEGNFYRGSNSNDWNEDTRAYLQKFEFLGKFIAKSIYDKRRIDIPISNLFWDYIKGRKPLLTDLKLISFEISKVVFELIEIVKMMKSDEKNERSMKNNKCLYHGRNIEDLCLYFNLPGYPNIELKHNGKNILVTLENLEEYISLILDSFLKNGIKRQIESFIKGFNTIFPIDKLNIFSPHEIDTLINGETETWTKSLLLNSISWKHGFTKKDQLVNWLVEILHGFNEEHKKAFLKFTTGSSRLPIGGIKALDPPFTVVRNDSLEYSEKRLPTCMTCVHFLKIPNYKSKKILKQKLFLAISEGLDRFHLS
ncbi:e3 ubiquitin-protein ligase trip12 [Anaeramoeba flamelloides]|uniref:HECT-type E3 ubiquitin transferase n=1 Tax=Anaeramoeba flamelloides TaxID=1746091 RepID=A0AAV8A7M1_9EUKA|nr:e3 ubiquitin-protein ligase trip12 [Anaeramoeba flamelloides]